MWYQTHRTRQQLTHQESVWITAAADDNLYMFKTLTKNIFSNYVGIAGTIIIAFLLSPYLVHTLGDTKYGVWSVISALTGYMALLDLGISSAIAKYVAKYKALKDYKSLNTVLASGLLICLLYTSPSPRDATLSRMPSSA